MYHAGQIADWWDEQRRISVEAVQKPLGDWVEKNPGFFSVMVATSVSTLVEFPMEVGAGVVDLLRFGQGAAEGGWGYAKDGLRLLAIAAPAMRGGRMMLSRVVPDPALDACTWVAATKALRQTGTRHFATIEDLAKAAKVNVPQLGPAWISEVAPRLVDLGAKVRMLKWPANQSHVWGGVKDVLSAVQRNPNGVVMFSVKLTNGGHTLLAYRDPIRGIVFADRTGKVARTLADIEKLGYPGLGQGLVYGSMAVVKNAKLVTGLNATSLLSMIALEVISVANPKPAKVKRKKKAAVKAPYATPVRNGSGARNGSATKEDIRSLLPTHTVSRGECLSSIADLWYGDMHLWPYIYVANLRTIGENPNMIHPKQVLVIP